MRCSVLGPFQVIDDAGTVALGGPRQRATLALLAARAGDPVSTDALIDQLWADAPPGRPRKTLQVYVANLRKALGPAATRLRSEPSGYRFVVGRDEVDALRFEDLVGRARGLRATAPEAAVGVYREALGLWRGEPFADLADQPALVPVAVRLQELRMAAAEELAEQELGLGRVAAAVADLQELTERYPLRERLWALLMEALYRQGRQAEALRAFQRVRHHLVEELGVEPSPELRAVEAKILQQVAAPAAARATLPAGERRPLTVLCAGLSVSGRPDAEDLADAVAAFRSAVADVVGHHGGVVAGAHDDRVVAYFGHRVASEDDLAQAIAAGLALTDLADAGSNVRVGIDSSTVVVSGGPEDSVGEAIGEAPMVAARLQADAQPGEVLVPDEIAARVRGSFELEALAGHRVRRGPTDAAVLRVVRPLSARERAAPDEGLAIVGREELIADLVNRARTGTGPLVVSGPGGIGKSTVAAEVARQLSELGWVVTTVRCSRRSMGTALHPFIPLLATDDVEAGAEPAAPGRRIEAVLTWLENRAGDQPQLLLVEDAHDADPTTISLLGDLVARGGLGALLVTTRAADPPSALDVTPVAVVRLGPLDRQAGRRLVRVAAGGRPLGTAVVNEIVDRSGGVPLFIEQLTVATVAAAAEQDSWRDASVDEVPSSLAASLAGRLDRLGGLKTTAQRCAVIGGDIDVATASVVLDRPHQTVTAELDALADDGILNIAGAGMYRFVHPLLEEAAYASILRRERARIHERLAGHLASVPGIEPAVLAPHVEAAGRHAEAIRLWCKAAQRRIDRSELPEAVGLAEHAVVGINRLDPSDERNHLERRALLMLAIARQLSRFGDRELCTIAARARSLALTAGDLGQAVTASLILIASLQCLGEYAAAQAAAEETIDIVGDQLGPELMSPVHHFLGATEIWRGRIDEGAARLGPLLDMWSSVTGPAVLGPPLVAVICALWSIVGLVDVVQDRAELAETRFEHAAQVALAAPAPQALCLVRCTQAMARQLLGDVEGTHALVEPILDLTLELGNDWWFVSAQILLGWSTAMAAHDRSGVAMIEEGLAHLGPMRQLAPYFHGLHGAALGATGEPAEGLTAVRHGLRLAKLTDERFFVPSLHATEADLLSLAGERDDVVAETRRRAAAIAQAQSQWVLARTFEATY